MLYSDIILEEYLVLKEKNVKNANSMVFCLRVCIYYLIGFEALGSPHFMFVSFERALCHLNPTEQNDLVDLERGKITYKFSSP